MEQTKKNGILHYAWVVFLVTVIFNFCYALCYSTVSLYMVPWLDKFPQYSRTAFSWVNSLHSVSSTVLLMYYGKLTEKVNMRWMVVIGSLGAAIGFAIYSVATSIWIFYVGALCVGCVCAFCATTTTSILINRWFGKAQNTLLSISMTIGGFGGTIGSILIGKWIAGSGYSSSLQRVALIQLAVGIVAFLLIRNSPEDKNTTRLWEGEAQSDETHEQDKVLPGVPMKSAKKTVNFWMILVFFFLFAGFFYGTYANLANVMYDFGLDATTVGAIFALVATSMTIAMVPGGTVMDFLGSRVTMIILTVVFAVILAVLGFLSPTAGVMRILCILFGIVYLIPKICVPAVIKTCFGERDLPSILGVATSCITLGAIFASPIMNKVYDITGSYTGAFKFCAIGAIVCAVFCIFFIKKCTKGWEE